MLVMPVSPQARPAETAGLAGALALLITRLLGVKDPDVLVSVGIVIAALPAGVTWLVELFRKGNAPPGP